MKLLQIVKNAAVSAIITASISTSITLSSQQLTAQQPILIAQATNTRKIVLPEFGYSFDLPSWARIEKVRNRGNISFDILTQKNYEARQRGDNKCSFMGDINTIGCADISIYIQTNGSKKLAETHKQLTTVCNCDVITGPNVYKGKITINGRTYRKYESGDESGTYNNYLYLTKDNHLLTVTLWKEPYKGNRDALVTILGSFKE
ncbi:hypothetical protein G7B40_029420 [Aetokthonos hydrillicola Thurmond2011]|jgi:hypothetical protein|uniref:Uncharacterized protein n=1 Tax=Aetokthonos hydrillicola Thurmond2011 TaxID=2712845 RepID=A0AAP5IFG2_9CYAN|nr:hypothetical protein [Aetokthonos hydrillicola]MBO3457141.1 hypothetical protein [Aetokthonos hydrillicola CCALA 1050]MBW4587487.1 hypothetical protein [Aetokthonos hydrillicola CCALA 1050]MDR9898648.1 hypothetical protein [Aetokthonos hydrillicola Thurmond2011]